MSKIIHLLRFTTFSFCLGVYIHNFYLGLSEDCIHKQHWGRKQQLLAGKRIADIIDKDNGGIDAVFGILLNPNAGTCFCRLYDILHINPYYY